MGRGLTEGEWAEIIRWEGRVKNVKRCGRRRSWAVGIVASNTPICFLFFCSGAERARTHHNYFDPKFLCRFGEESFSFQIQVIPPPIYISFNTVITSHTCTPLPSSWYLYNTVSYGGGCHTIGTSQTLHTARRRFAVSYKLSL